jgi:hypothetical protein
MDQHRTREVERLEVRDAWGKRYTIVKYQNSIVTRTMEQPPESIDTLGRYQAADGRRVNYDEATKTFTILDPFGDIQARR